VMIVSDKDGSIDRDHDLVAVLINSAPGEQTFTSPTLINSKLKPHPIHLLSPDPVAKRAKFNRATGEFTIPGRTAVVFWSSKSDRD
jgi:pullulanase